MAAAKAARAAAKAARKASRLERQAFARVHVGTWCLLLAECRVRITEYRVLHRVLNRAYLVPHQPTANRQPLTAREYHSRSVGISVPGAPWVSCLSLDAALDPALDAALLPLRPTGTVSPTGKRQSTDYRVLNRVLNRAYLLPPHLSANRQPPTACLPPPLSNSPHQRKVDAAGELSNLRGHETSY